jgi:type IV secretory pathway TrbD component
MTYRKENTSKIQWQPVFGDVLISAAVFIFACLYFTVAYDQDVSFIHNMAAGQFSDFPYIDFNYLAFIKINKIFKGLYSILPAYNWFGIILLFYEWCCLFLLVYTLRTLVVNDPERPVLTRVLQIMFAAYYIESVISLQHTRSSLFFCGIALFNLLFTQRISMTKWLLYSAVFLLGLFNRSESGLGMTLVVSTAYLIYTFRPIELIRRISIPLIATAAMLLSFSYDWSHTHEFVNKIEPEIEYKLMDNRVVGLSAMKTALDSVKYETATRGIWFDTEVLTPAYLRSILLPGTDVSVEHISGVIVHILSFYLRYTFIVVLWLIALAVCLVMRRRKLLLQICLLYLGSFMIMFLSDYNGHLLAGRHFLNLSLITALSLLYYLLRESGLTLGRKALIFASVLMFIGLGFTLSRYAAANTEKVQNLNCSSKWMQGFEDKYKGRLVVNTMKSLFLMDSKFGIYQNNYTANHYVMYDCFSYSLFPAYTSYLNRQCGCDAQKPIGFFQWLSGQRALYITTKDRADLTARYMNLQHGVKLKFVEVGDSDNFECHDEQLDKLKVYEVQM